MPNIPTEQKDPAPLVADEEYQSIPLVDGWSIFWPAAFFMNKAASLASSLPAITDKHLFKAPENITYDVC